MVDAWTLDLRGINTGVVWAFEFGVRFDLRSDNFATLKAFRKWLFDPEVAFERTQRVYHKSEAFDVPCFWPRAAIRILGLDVGLGVCVRAPLRNYITTTEEQK